MAIRRTSPACNRRGSLDSSSQRAWATETGEMVASRVICGCVSSAASSNPPAASTSRSSVPASQARRRITLGSPV